MEQQNELETLKRKPTTLTDILAGVVITSAIICGGMTGIFALANQYFNNVSYRIKDEVRQKKTDGIFTYTEVHKKDDDTVWVYRKNILEPIRGISYYDAKGDGFVDSVGRWENNSGKILDSHPVTYERMKDLEKYPHIFKEADADFRAQLKRFEEQ